MSGARVVFFIFVLGIVVYFFDFKKFNILNIEDTKDIFTLNGEALASIFGITIAITIFSLDVIKQKYYEGGIREFFKNKKLNSLFWLFSLTIIINFIGLAQTQIVVTKENINFAYLSIYLSVLILFCLFPTLKEIVSSSGSDDYVLNLFNQMEISNFETVNANNENSPDYLRHELQKPINQLINIGRNLTKKEENHSVYLFIAETKERLMKKLLNSNPINRRNIIKPYLRIFKSVYSQALIGEQSELI